MPTKPNPDIVPDYQDNPNLLRILANYAALIDEVVSFGSHVFGWVLEKTNKGDHHLAALSFYRRSLELLDSISPLIREACVSPSKVILRSLFEALLSLEYINQGDSEDRGRDYILCLKHKEVEYLRKFLRTDPLHADYVDKYRRDNLLNKTKIPEIPNLKEALEAKRRLIESKPYSSSETSYQAIRQVRKGQNPRWWFNLHDGPKDICDLAERMGRPAQYEVMYKNWAGYAHGTGSMDEQVEIIKKDEIAIPQLRCPDGAEFVAFMAMSYGLLAIKSMIQRYAIEKMADFEKWYKGEIQSGYMDLKQKRIIVK